MTMADLIYKAWGAIAAHRTKLAGTLTSALAFTATQHWLPANYVVGLLYISGMITIFCGVANTSTVAAKVAARANFTPPA